MGAMIYSEAEVNLLLNKAKEAGEPIRAAITLAVCYGMRRSEVLGLRWKDYRL
jgi:Phage integrase family.